jgi:plastocyanin
MSSFAKWLGAAAAATFVFVGAAGGASAASKPPVNLGQKVTNKGTKDVSKSSKAKLEVELDNDGSKYYFEPTFIKAKAGEKITIEANNEGNTVHTFTSDELSVDKELQAGKSAKFTVTVPSSGAVFQFHCTFHADLGMIGAVFTKKGASATQSSTQSSSSGGTPGY